MRSVPTKTIPRPNAGVLYLKPYPQYGGLYELGVLGASERYHSVELKAQKAFSQGYNFLVSYVYIRERTQSNTFNDLDALQNNLVYHDSNQLHHRFDIAGTWELPVGRGHPFMNNAPKVVDAILGGWKVAGLWTFIAGDFPRFGNLLASGNPCMSNPNPKGWFNTSVFSRIPANTYVLRTNRLNRADPDTNVLSSTFGQTLFQGSPGGSFGIQGATYGNQSGRQVELGMKITS
jgi:hypothetical protein